MKATINNFFGSSLEQEVSDPVVILPFAIRNTNSGVITLPDEFRWVDFDSIEIGLGLSSNADVFATNTLPKYRIQMEPSTWKERLSFAANNGDQRSVRIEATSEKTATWTGDASLTCWPYYMVGYKRRIARVGIDELMSAMSLPNLIANADLTDNPINQRGFDGNWAALAVGVYGYDQWMKVSSTHMGAVIEAGKYRPNAKHTLTKDDVVIGEFMSPASGHWTVAVPFATSGKFDLYAGQFKRPWHPVLDGEERCLRYFYMSDGTSFTFDNANYGSPQISNGSPMGRHIFYPTRMRTTTPSVSIASINPDGLGSHVGVNHSTRSFCYISLKANTPTGVNPYVYAMILRVDASITLAELNGQIIYLQ
ncbi:TPA: hypothetical protein AB5E57_001661 [Vibrio cholerae]